MWVAAVGEELSCVRETENHRDPFPVAVVLIYQSVMYRLEREDHEDRVTYS